MTGDEWDLMLRDYPALAEGFKGYANFRNLEASSRKYIEETDKVEMIAHLTALHLAGRWDENIEMDVPF